jgi:hypothetical protein
MTLSFSFKPPRRRHCSDWCVELLQCAISMMFLSIVDMNASKSFLINFRVFSSQTPHKWQTCSTSSRLMFKSDGTESSASSSIFQWCECAREAAERMIDRSFLESSLKKCQHLACCGPHWSRFLERCCSSHAQLKSKNGSSGCPWFDVMNHHIDGTRPSSQSSSDASIQMNSHAFCPQMTHCDMIG